MSIFSTIRTGFPRGKALGAARGREAAGKLRSPERLAQPRQDLLGVELQETRLIRAGGVEDEVAEAEFDIGPDFLDLLVGVARHDPAACGTVKWQRIGETLHLDRILDADLLLG